MVFKGKTPLEDPEGSRRRFLGKLGMREWPEEREREGLELGITGGIFPVKSIVIPAGIVPGLPNTLKKAGIPGVSLEKGSWEEPSLGFGAARTSGVALEKQENIPGLSRNSLFSLLFYPGIQGNPASLSPPRAPGGSFPREKGFSMEKWSWEPSFGWNTPHPNSHGILIPISMES